MSDSFAHADRSTPLRCSENSTPTAKVHTSARKDRPVPTDAAKVHAAAHRKAETAAYRADLGKCIQRALNLSELTLELFADAIKRDASQVGKWMRNVEPPQLDPILMSSMRGVMLQALAERTPGCEVTTEIRVRRTT